jgi:hypothetical protein
LRSGQGFGKGAIRFGVFRFEGRLAQLVEHLVYTERVSGSSPLAPTTLDLFIVQQALGRQVDVMGLGKILKFVLVAITLGVVAQPAFANNKDRTKRTEAAPACTDACKPVVRSMSESTPQRKNDCPRTRRILM